MIEEIIENIISKYENDIVVLDSFLQWALNPTSMSAGYGIDANYRYIEQNLLNSYNPSDSDLKRVMDLLKDEINKIMEYKEDDHSVYDFRKRIKNELSKEKYVEVFQDFYLDKIKNSNENIKNFLRIYSYSPVKTFPCLCVQYNAIYGKDINIDELVNLGILKPLLWISSGKSRRQEETPVMFPFLERITDRMDNTFFDKMKKLLGLSRMHPKKPDIDEYFEKLVKDKKFETFMFLKDLYEKEKIYTYVLEDKGKVSSEKGIIGVYKSPYSLNPYGGISYLIKDELFSVIDKYFERLLDLYTQNIINILEYENNYGKLPSKKELIREFDISISEIDTYDKWINEIPIDDFSDDNLIKTLATNAIRKVEDPSLLGLLRTCGYNIEIARKVGKHLIDQHLIKDLRRVPNETDSLKTMRQTSKTKNEKEKICPECSTPLDDRENMEYCPFCGKKL